MLVGGEAIRGGAAYGAEGLLEFLVFGDGLVGGVGVGVGAGVGVGVGVVCSASRVGLAGGQDGVFARVPDQQAASGVGGGFDEVVLYFNINSRFHENRSRMACVYPSAQNERNIPKNYAPSSPSPSFPSAPNSHPPAPRTGSRS